MLDTVIHDVYYGKFRQYSALCASATASIDCTVVTCYQDSEQADSPTHTQETPQDEKLDVARKPSMKFLSYPAQIIPCTIIFSRSKIELAL